VRVNDAVTVLSVLHDLTGPDPEHRVAAATRVTDLVQSLRPEEVLAMASVLVMARLAEHEPEPQEAQLYAILELDTWHRPLPQVALARLWEIDPTTIGGTQATYLMELLTGKSRFGEQVQEAAQ
jgi:hypothetical protein